MTDLPEIHVIGVLGAGQMGGGIAQVAATSGYEVKLADASLDLAQRGLAKVDAILGKQVSKGKMSDEMKRSILSKIVAVPSARDFADCDLVIEAATEKLELK